jgi:fructose-bisphosphate aldolase class II
MAVVSILEEVRKARAEGRAVPLFVCGDMTITQGVVAACESASRPGIVGLWAGLFDRPGGPEYVRWALAVAGSVDVPVSVMLDHGRKPEDCVRAVSLGFTDVMFDGSLLPFEENLAAAKEVVAAAHCRGVGVEAELGIVGRGSEYDTQGSLGVGLTDPAEAERFAAETGCDILAVAIGSAHGYYTSAPRLDLERLAEIRQRVDLPLAMHGGSGLSPAQFRSAIAGGIAKVNIGTDLGAAARDSLAAVAQETEVGYYQLRAAARKAVQERAEHYLSLFAMEHAPAAE